MKATSKRKTERRPADAEVGVVVTDLKLKPLAYDRGAAEILNGGIHSGDDEPLRLPPEVVEAFQSRDTSELAKLKVHFMRGRASFSCRAYLLEPKNGAIPEPVLTVMLQRDSNADDAISAVTAEYGLTDREEQVLRGLSMGLTTKELAARMNRSPNTIKMFLRLIMNKMRVTTRSGIVGKVLDHVE